jgi:site-specific recombinase XerD
VDLSTRLAFLVDPGSITARRPFHVSICSCRPLLVRRPRSTDRGHLILSAYLDSMTNRIIVVCPGCNVRSLFLLSLMLDTGLRLSEAIHLRWKDIDLNSGKVMVRQGKGAKDRTLWTGEHNLAALVAWRDRQASECGGSPQIVFTTKKGDKLDPRYIQRMVKRYAVKAGIEKDITPHTLRHSFATDLYRETTNIRLTQKALGHANLATTQIYTHIVDEELEGALKSFRCATVTA